MIKSIANFLRGRIWSALPAAIAPRQRAWAALLWGGAPIVLGIWRGVRGAHVGALAIPALLILGGAALAVLLLVPATGSGVYLAVLRFFSVIGFLVSTLLLTLAFYLFVTPMGWVLRLSGKDLLDIRPDTPPAWRDHSGKPDRKRYYRLS